MQGPALYPLPVRLLCGLLSMAATACHRHDPPAPSEPYAQVTEVRQLSVTEDPAVTANFPPVWQINRPSGPTPSPAESEIDEFDQRLAKVQLAPLVQEDLAAGATRKVDLPLTGPAGLSGSVRWIGTTNPLKIVVSQGGADLPGTGTVYHLGHDRGGASVNARTNTSGTATISVTNTTTVAVKLRIVFGATAL